MNNDKINQDWGQKAVENNLSAEVTLIHERLLDKKVLDGDLETTYCGHFESPEEFAYKRLYGNSDICVVPDGYCYKKYAQELFLKKFVFVSGHVFVRR